MQDKLQQLTEKLYNEGLEKGKQEAQKMLEDAKTESERIIAEAKQKSSEMIAAAEKEALQLREKAEGDIQTASRQALSQIKQDIEQAVRMKAVEAPVKEALSAKEFMQSVIKTVAGAFNPDKDAVSLDLILPQAMKEDMNSFIEGELASAFGKGLDVSFTKDISNGFKISRKGSGYFIDFSEDSFNRIISEYIRPKTRKLIFGE